MELEADVRAVRQGGAYGGSVLPQLLTQRTAVSRLQALRIGEPASFQLHNTQLTAIAGCSATLQQLALLSCAFVEDDELCQLVRSLPYLKVKALVLSASKPQTVIVKLRLIDTRKDKIKAKHYVSCRIWQSMSSLHAIATVPAY